MNAVDLPQPAIDRSIRVLVLRVRVATGLSHRDSGRKVRAGWRTTSPRPQVRDLALTKTIADTRSSGVNGEVDVIEMVRGDLPPITMRTTVLDTGTHRRVNQLRKPRPIPRPHTPGERQHLARWTSHIDRFTR
jgi:hypothetical protein